MPVASDPERPPAAQHAVRLSRFVELRWHARSHPSRAVCGVPGARRTRGWHHRPIIDTQTLPVRGRNSTRPWQKSAPTSKLTSSGAPITLKAVLSNRWIVERTIAWLTRGRRLAKDWENLNRKGACFLAPVPSGMWLEFARRDLQRREAIRSSIRVQTGLASRKRGRRKAAGEFFERGSLGKHPRFHAARSIG